jgi:hypothetical protein
MSRAQIRATFLLGTVVAAMLLPPVGRATGGRYAFAGGTPREQDQVTRALDASSFDWSAVPVLVTIHIAPLATSYATPGEIWLDKSLLAAGRMAWGVVQHEYAHEVDFFDLTPSGRSLLQKQLGATTWSSDAIVRRNDLGCELFASAVAWSYWPVRDNIMRFAAPRDLSALRFRGVVQQLLGARGVR